MKHETKREGDINSLHFIFGFSKVMPCKHTHIIGMRLVCYICVNGRRNAYKKVPNDLCSKYVLNWRRGK